MLVLESQWLSGGTRRRSSQRQGRSHTNSHSQYKIFSSRHDDKVLAALIQVHHTQAAGANHIFQSVAPFNTVPMINKYSTCRLHPKVLRIPKKHVFTVMSFMLTSFTNPHTGTSETRRPMESNHLRHRNGHTLIHMSIILGAAFIVPP